LGRDIPATGMSLGLERIIDVVQEFNLLPTHKTVARIFVACTPESLAQANQVASTLRTHGINTDLSLLAHRSLGEQLRYADRRGIPFAVIVGPDELARGAVTVKNLRSGDQQEVEMRQLVTVLRSHLEA
jgi:histidyl-tRNA synthetase